MKIQIHDAVTGETIERDMTPEEIAEMPKPVDIPTDEEQPNSIGVFNIAHRLRRPHTSQL